MIFSSTGWVAPYWPIGAMAVIFFVFYLSMDWINSKIRYKDFGDSLWELEEGLGNYWAALSKVDRDWTKKEE